MEVPLVHQVSRTRGDFLRHLLIGLLIHGATRFASSCNFVDRLGRDFVWADESRSDFLIYTFSAFCERVTISLLWVETLHVRLADAVAPLFRVGLNVRSVSIGRDGHTHLLSAA